MLPLVINDDPQRLILVAMQGSVGARAGNDSTDTRFIQTLLNAVPQSFGGPQQLLKVDGIVGPKTIAAIQKFQSRNTRVPDGRVDVSGPTIQSLVKLLRSKNLLPPYPSKLGPVHPDIAMGLTGRAATRSPAPVSGELYRGNYGIDYLGPMGWKVDSTSGIDGSISAFGGVVTNLYMTHETEPGRSYKFSFVGLGVGVSNLPVGLDFSLKSFPSFGSNVTRISMQAKLPPIEAVDLSQPACLIALGGNLPFIIGVGTGLMFIGAIVPMPGVADYGVFFAGLQAGVPKSVAANFYVGRLERQY